MNKKQWNTIGFIFMVLGIFFMWKANLSADTMLLANPESLVAVASSIRSAIYGSIGTICFGLFFIFIICGYFEKENKRKTTA